MNKTQQGSQQQSRPTLPSTSTPIQPASGPRSESHEPNHPPGAFEPSKSQILPKTQRPKPPGIKIIKKSPTKVKPKWRPLYKEEMAETSNRRKKQWKAKKKVLKMFLKTKGRKFSTQRRMMQNNQQRKRELSSHLQHLNQKIGFYSNWVISKNKDVEQMKELIKRREQINEDKKKRRKLLSRAQKSQNIVLKKKKRAVMRSYSQGRAQTARRLIQISEANFKKSQKERVASLKIHRKIAVEKKRRLRAAQAVVRKVKNMEAESQKKRLDYIKQIFKDISVRVHYQARLDQRDILEKQLEIKRRLKTEKKLAVDIETASRMHTTYKGLMDTTYKTQLETIGLSDRQYRYDPYKYYKSKMDALKGKEDMLSLEEIDFDEDSGLKPAPSLAQSRQRSGYLVKEVDRMANYEKYMDFGRVRSSSHLENSGSDKNGGGSEKLLRVSKLKILKGKEKLETSGNDSLMETRDAKTSWRPRADETD